MLSRMSTFHGPRYKGAMRDHRRIKREEAEERNAPDPSGAAQILPQEAPL